MATIPYFAIGPTIILGLIGLVYGSYKTKPTPKDDWRKAVVDVIIPAYNAVAEIDLCLASLSKQTMKLRKITIYDDGSYDKTKICAEDFAKRMGMDNVQVIRRERSEGKTPSLRSGAMESDADVEFILDSDTFLLSDKYIERTVQELYKGIGIASACGVILPTTNKSRSRLLADPVVGKPLQAHFKKHPDAGYFKHNNWFVRLARGITNLYRDTLYKFLQRFVYRTQMIFFGTIINPVGCAVAYRREYIKDVFISSSDVLGDDLTTSEDVYIGFAFVNEGYRNIQLQDVTASTLEPPIYRMPKQMFMWSSAFFQSNYYFKHLVFTPFKIFRRIAAGISGWGKNDPGKNKRKIQEAYRQRFGGEWTQKFGRPIGWFIFTEFLEKVAFPIVLIVFMALQWWWALLFTFAIETLVSSFLLALVTKGERIKMFFKAILISPIRYISLIFDVLVLGWFIVEIFITKNRGWRK